MRHKVSKPKLNRAKGPRRALQVNQLTTLIKHEYITTTSSKARAVKDLMDRVISIAKKNDSTAKRYVTSIVNDKLAVEKVFKVFVPRYESRTSGFSSSVKVGFRNGDNAPLVKVIMMGFMEEKEEKAKQKKKTKTKSKSTKK